MKEALKLALDYIVATNKSSEFWLIPASNLNKTVTAIKEALAQPEQEPVAWLHTKIEGVAVPHRPADLDKHPDRWEALYKTPSPCPTCEALARTVMLDQTSYDTTPPQRIWDGLTDEEIVDAYDVARVSFKRSQQGIRGQQLTSRDSPDWHYAKAIEAKLKEKNT